MAEQRMDWAVTAMSGELERGDGARLWRGAAIDSRSVKGGELFFALAGSRTDGHAFALAAARAGAAGVVIERAVDGAESAAADTAWIRVDDTFEALHALTRAMRQHVPENLVAITGSAGKTTTKELLAAMLGRSMRVAKSLGNFNNLYGFPLSLLAIDNDSQWMVAEMGMSTPGELAEVSRLGQPDAVVLTNVRPVHLENFRSLADIAEAKAEVMAGLSDDGWVIANADDPEVMRVVSRHPAARAGRLVTFGVKQAADFSAHRIQTLAADAPLFARDLRIGCRFDLRHAYRDAEDQPHSDVRSVELPVHGLYNVENCLAAAACAVTLGASLDDVVAAAAAFQPSTMRGEVERLPGGPTLIDDSYNSNPDAVARALESARLLPASRRIAILGDMLELGLEEAAFHRQIGRRAVELGFDYVVAVGELSRQVMAEVEAQGGSGLWFADADAAAAWLAAGPKVRDRPLGNGDLVLIKGSRGIQLEKAVAALRKSYGKNHHDSHRDSHRDGHRDGHHVSAAHSGRGA